MVSGVLISPVKITQLNGFEECQSLQSSFTLELYTPHHRKD